MTSTDRRTTRGRPDLRRGPAVLSLAALTVTLMLLPLGTRSLGPTTSFVPAVLAVVACFDLMSMWLLAGEYADTGDRRFLAMAVAYLWSLTLMGGYTLAFPGVVSTHPPLAVTASVAPYLYLGWHVGFPALLGLAWAPWAVLARTDEPGRRTRAMVVATLITATAALGAIGSCLASVRSLPVLIHGLNTTAMTEFTAPIALPVVITSLILCARGVRGRSGPERWTQLTIAVCTCDLLLTYASRHRYSLGWYAGRTMTVTAAATVLVAMLAAFRRLKAEAEFNAAYDGLTGLPNRQSTYDALATMIVRAQRMRADLTVVMFDLDHFKQVNDTYGHAAGDIILRAVAASMRATVRESDIIGRVGGEEFLILLPDATEQDAQLIVERLRASLRLTGVAYLESGVTASFGIAGLHAADATDGDTTGDATADDLAQRADQAMYEAKTAGRDRIALASRAA